MGDRYEWKEPCPKCGKELLCMYADSCLITSVTCPNCGTTFDLELYFKLVSRKKKRATKSKED